MIDNANKNFEKSFEAQKTHNEKIEGILETIEAQNDKLLAKSQNPATSANANALTNTNGNASTSSLNTLDTLLRVVHGAVSLFRGFWPSDSSSGSSSESPKSNTGGQTTGTRDPFDEKFSTPESGRAHKSRESRFDK